MVPSVNRRAGHPILIKTHVVLGIEDSNALHLRAFLENRPKTYVCVEDQGVLIDIDTPADYKKYGKEG